jgi:hypothetical protein
MDEKLEEVLEVMMRVKGINFKRKFTIQLIGIQKLFVKAS